MTAAHTQSQRHFFPFIERTERYQKAARPKWLAAWLLGMEYNPPPSTRPRNKVCISGSWQGRSRPNRGFNTCAVRESVMAKVSMLRMINAQALFLPTLKAYQPIKI